MKKNQKNLNCFLCQILKNVFILLFTRARDQNNTFAIDGAISSLETKSAAAAILRDDEGMFLGAPVLVIDGVLDPSCVEVVACREGLCLLQDIQRGPAIIASDCAGAIRGIEGGSKGESETIIKEVQVILSGMGDVKFCHERRECNIDAHNIAKYSLVLLPGRHVYRAPMICKQCDWSVINLGNFLKKRRRD